MSRPYKNNRAEKMSPLQYGNNLYKKKEFLNALIQYRESNISTQAIKKIVHKNSIRCLLEVEKIPLKNAYVTVFAGYSQFNKIEDYVIHYTKKLKGISKYLVYVADNNLPSKELAKLSGIADFIISGRHEEYDFGSYKRGIEHLSENGILQNNHLILANDSCYGPMTGFKEILLNYENSNFDFWGLTQNSDINPHIQSYFMVYQPKVAASSAFIEFFSSVKKQNNVQEVILQYETKHTEILENHGFKWSTFINNDKNKTRKKISVNTNLTVFPIHLIEEGAQLIKVKSIYKPTTNWDGIKKTLNLLKSSYPNIYQQIANHGLVEKFIHHNGVNFSIILPTFNRGNLIENSIKSISKQIKSNDELIIVDDGSTDHTKLIIENKFKKQLESKQFKYIQLAKNYGVARARNIGLGVAKNEWIAYLDSDNTLLPFALDIYENAIIANPEKICFYSRMQYQNTKKRYGRPFNRKNLSQANFIDMGVFIHRKNSPQVTLHDENLTRLVDWDFIISYTKNTEPEFLPITTLIYNDSNSLDRISNKESFENARLKIQKKHNIKPLVTTVVLVHQHEKYLNQCLESILNQEISGFDHEIFVLDDCSTDRSWNIFLEYSKANPGKMKGLRHEKNIGQAKNMQQALLLANGNYIAIIEGDDYWISPQKLVKQFNFLENNTDCSMVFSQIDVLDEKSKKLRKLERQTSISITKLTAKNFLDEKSLNLIANFSCCMFRRSVAHELPEFVFEDRVTEMMIAFHFEKFGYIGYIPETLSIYRQHDKGLWTGATKKEQLNMALKARENLKKISREIWLEQIESHIKTIKSESSTQ